MAYKHPQLSPMQMAFVVESTRELERIMGKYTFLNCYKRHDEFFEKWWTVNDPVITLNDRKYIGVDAVRAYFCDYSNEQTKWANQVMRQLHPDELGGKSDEEIWAVGSNTVLTFTTPIIEIAYDGKTAKGIWYIMGEETEVYKAGPKANWYFGRCAVDFVNEDGKWKIWHMMLCTEFQTPLGGNWGDVTKVEKEGVALPLPTETGSYYPGYGPDFISRVDPPLPEPYDTFENTFSY